VADVQGFIESSKLGLYEELVVAVKRLVSSDLRPAAA